MTPETAVARLAELVGAQAELSEDALYAAMAAAGLPGPVADRAYKFTQIAWGRAFLDGLGVSFSPDYLCFNGAGEVIESGRLAEQPYFEAAMAVLRQSPPANWPHFAVMSAEVNTVNSALKSGSKASNLALAPQGLFMEAPTPAGMDKARRVLTERLAPRKKKSWWRFW